MKKAIDQKPRENSESSHGSHVRPAVRPQPSSRSGVISLHWNAPSKSLVEGWHRQVGAEDFKPILLLEGPTPAHRATVYRNLPNLETVSKEWGKVGLIEAVTSQFATIQAEGSRLPYRWGLIWSLLMLEDIKVEDSLHYLVDQGSGVSDVFKGLWEARWRLREGHEVYGLIEALTSWMTGVRPTQEGQKILDGLRIRNRVESNYERLDMLFFLTTLSRQNGLLDRVILVVDGIDRYEERSKEVYDLCLTAERWARLGSPVGVVLGYESLIGLRPPLATTLHKYV